MFCFGDRVASSNGASTSIDGQIHPSSSRTRKRVRPSTRKCIRLQSKAHHVRLLVQGLLITDALSFSFSSLFAIVSLSLRALKGEMRPTE